MTIVDATKQGEEETVYLARIREAVSSLTDTELNYLRSYARRRIKMLRLEEVGYDEDDLLHQALVSMYAGRRRWDPERVEFYWFFRGVLASLSHNWFRKHVTNQHVALEGVQPEWQEYALTSQGDVDRDLDFKDMIERMEKILLGDAIATKVFHCLLNGYTHAETQRLLGTPRQVYDHALHRIRRVFQAVNDPL
jgi:DNA-directed RNA polymerase specialized sigma24 family protein